MGAADRLGVPAGSDLVDAVRRRAKVDANQKQVTAELRQAGVFVEPRLSRIGGGVPDLLIAFRGRWALVELKDPSQPPSARALTDDEAEWIAKAEPHAPVIVACTTEEILTYLLDDKGG